MARHARNPPVIWGAAAMGHPWPSAAKPASCRFTPQITVEFRPSCLTGRSQIKVTIKSADQKTADFASEKDVRAEATATATAEPNSVTCGSWLACDSINSVYLTHQGVCIAGKPAPTERQIPQKSTCSVHANPQPTSYSKLHAVNCVWACSRMRCISQFICH